MIERLLVDGELRDRMVAEASEHVLSFDWDDIARRTRAIYGELAPRRGLRGQARMESPRGQVRGGTREQGPRTKTREQGVKRA